jgi:Protein of unknown function (DUF4229)
VSQFVRYTVLRFGLLVVVLAALALVGVRGILLPALAVLISLPLSYVLLARQRNAFAAEVERRVHERQERRSALRADMAGEPAAAEDYSADAYLTEEDLAGQTAAPVDPPEPELAGHRAAPDEPAEREPAGNEQAENEPAEGRPTTRAASD